MCTGATKGFAVLKFSTSPSKLGEREINIIIRIIKVAIGSESLNRNSGLNFSLSLFEITLDGLEEPVSCNRIR